MQQLHVDRSRDHVHTVVSETAESLIHRLTGAGLPLVAVNSSAVNGLPRPVPEIKFWGITRELHTASEKAEQEGALDCLLLASRLGGLDDQISRQMIRWTNE